MHYNVWFRGAFLLMVLVVLCKGQDKCILGTLETHPSGPISTEDVDGSQIHQFTGLEEFGGPVCEECGTDPEKYFCKHVEIKDDDTTITLNTKDMESFEVNYPNDGNAALMCVNIKAKCNPNVVAKVNILVGDTNNHAPEFLEETYTYEIPMPFPAEMALDDCLNPSVKSKDIDFMAGKPTFTVESDDLDIRWFRLEEGQKNKVHSALLTVKRTLNFDEKSYTITANDGQLSGTATVVIKKKEGASVVQPMFVQSYYEYKFADGSLTETEMLLKDAENANFVINKYTDYFEVDPSGYPTVKLMTKKPLYEIVDDNVAFSIEASVDNQDNPALTAVFVDILHPAFEKNYYTGEFSKEPFESPVIILKNGIGAVVTILPPDDEYFEVDNKYPTIKIKPRKSVEEIVEDYIHLSLQAKIEESSRFSIADVTIKIVKEIAPMFENPHYECEYVDGQLTETKIVIKNGENAQYKIKGYDKYFSVDTTEYPDLKLLTKKPLYDILEDTIALTIKATVSNLEPALTAVFVDIVNPVFDKNLYTAKYSNDPFKTPKITLQTGKDAVVTIRAPGDTYFEVDNTNNPTIKISPIKQLDEIEENYVHLSLEAIIPGSTRVTTADVAIEIVKNAPMFVKSYYEFNYVDGVLQDVNMVLKDGKNANFEVITKPEYKDYFEVEKSGYPNIKLLAKKSLYGIAADNVALSIKATVTNLEPALTAIVVDILHPSFDKNYYTGEYSKDPFVTPKIMLQNGKDAVVTIKAPGDTYFEVDYSENPIIKISPIEPLEDITDDYILVSLEAKIVESTRVATVDVAIKIVKETDPECTTTSSTTPTKPTETTTSTTTENPYSITFQNPTELVQIYSWDIQKHYQFTATSSYRPDVVTYELFEESGDLPGSIHLGASDGWLETTAPTPSKIYRLIVKATGSISGAYASTSVILNVINVQICDDDDIRTAFAMQIINVKEGVEETILPVDKEHADYKFSIIDQVPNKSMFDVQSDGSITCKKLDREADYFNGLAVAQYTIIVQLDIENPSPRNMSRRSIKRHEEFVGEMVNGISMFRQIEQNMIRTVIVVIVDDVNDNPPIFAQTEVVVCYPSEDLLSRIRPSHLLRVEATDLDSIETGYGKIKYTTNSEAIVIDEDTGVVYATKDLYNNDNPSFTVQATDGGGLSAEKDLTVKVKIIREDQIAEIQLTNTPLHKLDEKLDELSQLTGLTIKSFSVTPYFPTGKSSKRNTRDVEDYSFHVVIYGLQSDEPVTAEVLKKKLEEESDVEVEPLVQKNNDNDMNGETTGLIAAVSVLAVLLAIVLLSVTAFWYFKLRTKKSIRPEADEETGSIDDDTSNGTLFTTNSIGQKQSPLKHRRPTKYVHQPPPMDDDDDGLDNNKNDSYIIFGSTEADSTDAALVGSESDTDALKSVVGRKATAFFKNPPPLDSDSDNNDDTYKMFEPAASSDAKPSTLPDVDLKPSDTAKGKPRFDSKVEEIVPLPPVDYDDPKKTVKFNVVVEKIPIESVKKSEDDDDDDDDEDGEDGEDGKDGEDGEDGKDGEDDKSEKESDVGKNGEDPSTKTS